MERAEFYKNLLDNLSEGVYFVDNDRKITYWNKGAQKITGYSEEEVIGKQCSDNILMHVDGKGQSLCVGLCPLAECMACKRACSNEVYLHHKKGYRIPVSVRVSPINDEKGKIIGAVELFSDNTDRMIALKRAQELQQIAFLDELTGIGNRRYTEINIRAKLDELKRYKWGFGVIFSDIDHFKKVNDTYGHDTGDEILKMVAKTMSSALRSFDFLGRWGGEEFVAIAVNVDKNELYGIAEKLRHLVEKSGLKLQKENLTVTISSGATLAHPDDTISSLIKRADKLMYQSKSNGRNQVTMDK
ncbi:MAG: sensor domain-containing diguanylate cyclase [Planctomycetes bacterium]|nr:sensor domain-containing diguanylate cyclase [Planctomycetota bacterium]